MNYAGGTRRHYIKSPLPGEIIHEVFYFFKVFMKAMPFRGGFTYKT
jgi:hypothetical protein